jgi:phospholipid/cholesterol/gamma-HCH transport system permease protein
MSSAQLSLAQAPDGGLVVQFAGPWLLRSERPAPRELESALDPARVRRVDFDARELSGWDSALVAFLARVLRTCEERGIAADRAGLPEGVRRLLALAEAVPERSGARRDAGEPPPWIERLGLLALRAAGGLAAPLAFLGEVTLASLRLVVLRARFPMRDFLFYVQQCGAQALPIVTLIGFLIGLILAFMGAVQLLRFGATIYVADLVALAMVREMGAVMTAVVMAGRTGAAFAAQLGTMKVTEEIDALRTLGLSPIEFLVLPRMLALVAMMPLLTLYADFWGIVGGVVVSATMLDLTVTQYLNETFAAATMTDVVLGVVKSVVFGALVALASCYQGMRTGDSASAVGESATRAVVNGIVLIIVTDGIFAVLCNILGI